MSDVLNERCRYTLPSAPRGSSYGMDGKRIYRRGGERGHLHIMDRQ